MLKEQIISAQDNIGLSSDGVPSKLIYSKAIQSVSQSITWSSIQSISDYMTGSLAPARISLKGPQLLKKEKKINFSTLAYLCCNKEDWDIWGMVLNLRDPFVFHVVQRCSAIHRETQQENICAGVGQRTQSIIVFLHIGKNSTTYMYMYLRTTYIAQ